MMKKIILFLALCLCTIENMWTMDPEADQADAPPRYEQSAPPPSYDYLFPDSHHATSHTTPCAAAAAETPRRERSIAAAIIAHPWQQTGILSDPICVDEVTWNTDCTTLASASQSGTTIWNSQTETAIQVLGGGPSYATAWSPDGQTLALEYPGNTIILWKWHERIEKILQGHTSPVKTMAFSPDGKILASGSLDDTIRLWNTKTGEAVGILRGQKHSVDCVAWSPNGKIIASAGSGTINLWDSQTGRKIHGLHSHDLHHCISSVAWNPDGTTCASSTAPSKKIYLWDIRAEQEITMLCGHDKWVNSVAWHPDGTTLASASMDTTIRLWDTRTKGTTDVLIGHTNWVNSVAWNPNGSTLASGAWDGTIRLWQPVSR